MNALALDLGASGGKIILGRFDGRKISLEEIHRFTNRAQSISGHLVWDLDNIWGQLLLGIRKAAALGFDSLSIDSFCNDYGLLDSHEKLLTPIYSYRDARTEGILEKMTAVIPPRELYERTGCQSARFNTLVQLVALSRGKEREALNRTETLLFLSDLLNFRLCGVKAAEYTTASVSQLFNRRENQWDKEILAKFQIPGNILSPVIAPGTFLGAVRKEILDQTGAKAFSMVTCGQHDTASAVAAVPAVTSPFAYISSGTWSLMGTELTDLITTEKSYSLNFANEGGVEKRNRFLKNIMGLWLLQECREQWSTMGKEYSVSELDSLAGQSLPLRSIINPDDPSFYEPGKMIDKIRDFCESHKEPIPVTPGEVVRCILESLGFAYRRTLEQLESITGFHFQQVHIIGGGSRSQLLNQIAANLMNRTVVVGPVEAAAVGNLCAQFISAGEIHNLDEARGIINDSFSITRFTPQPDPRYEIRYHKFLTRLSS